MKKKLQVLTWLLVVSVVFNVYGLLRLGAIAEQVQNLSARDYPWHWDSRIGSIENSLWEMQENTRWVINTEFVPNRDTSSSEEIHLDLTWSFRELEQDAKVSVLYRPEGSGEWLQSPAQSRGSGNFTAALTITELEKNYQYQVVSEGSVFRAGDVDTIPARYYRRFPVVLMGWGGGQDVHGKYFGHLNMTFQQPEPSYFDFFEATRVWVEVFYQGEPPRNIDLAGVLEPWGGGKTWNLELEQVEELKSAFVYVEYGDGTITQGQFWPEPHLYMEETKLKMAP